MICALYDVCIYNVNKAYYYYYYYYLVFSMNLLISVYLILIMAVKDYHFQPSTLFINLMWYSCHIESCLEFIMSSCHT